ncbi:E3 ubiquitin-protein ligase RNF19A isoform X2 [Megalops cyprinoides]|uniref:E3 ubiquitin-protein ligase RNF19A isoform X2 n=1 Tax=Megalops cyprinoides TaxID=118141 RepID=UPI0018640C34|nr:E3 ubiquitin-protein ligase RNF19A isoform X2 [Megalops cyprinoides]
MKRPKQHQHLSFLSFFTRKPKSEAKPDRAGAARAREDVSITLTPSEQSEQAQSIVGGEGGGGGGGRGGAVGGGEGEGADCSSNAEGDGGWAGALSLSSCSQDQLLDQLECPLCLLIQPSGSFPRLSSCPHRSCTDCLRQYLRIQISESRVGIACPQCPEALAPPDIHAILDDRALLERFEEYQLRRFLAADPDTRWCPAPDCSYAVIAYGCAECPKLSCGREGCDTEFCYHCRQLWHPDQTCDQARRQRSRHASANNDASTLFVFNEESGSEVEEIKACPRCSAYIMKTNDGSCNRMNCSVCGCQFCWLCMQEITDVHYLSPSGCTFWGKKPWSQSRKVLWQVGMLLGAPVVISLIAGIAIPVIIVGIPIYMGRKVHSRCKKNNISGSKHYLTVASGVMMSVFVSPVIAAVTVGVGVPLMMTYVYGVVPMSLCRNGWCRTQKDQPEPRKIRLEDLTNFSDHWTGQSNLAVSEASMQEVSVQEVNVQEVSVQEVRVLPSTSTSPPDRQSSAERGDAVVDPFLREGMNIEVQVEIEAHPRDGWQLSLSSVLSSRSLSAESLRRSREQLCAADTPIPETDAV